MELWLLEQKELFYRNFIEDQRWKYLTGGVAVTLEVTFFALALGLVIGLICAVIRTVYDQNKPDFPGFGLLNWLVQCYLTVIRGTPVVLQLLIGYFLIFVTSTNMVLVASLVFGINSGAYITEILRSGILSVDPGQAEAGRSLGLNYTETMGFIVIPQAFKTVLPTLANECIALLKETAVCGYIGLTDLTKAGDIIRGRTFSAFMPLIAVAGIYLAIVMLLGKMTAILEQKLRAAER